MRTVAELLEQMEASKNNIEAMRSTSSHSGGMMHEMVIQANFGELNDCMREINALSDANDPEVEKNLPKIMYYLTWIREQTD